MTVAMVNSDMPSGNINGEPSRDNDDGVPGKHYLRFPPFPSLDSASGIKPFDEYQVRGVNVPSLPLTPATNEAVRTGLDGWVDDVTQHGTDSFGNPLVAMPAASTSPSKPKLAAGRVALEDSWKAGNEPDWVDPAPRFALDNNV